MIREGSHVCVHEEVSYKKKKKNRFSKMAI